jgi:hypothetical protein
VHGLGALDRHIGEGDIAVGVDVFVHLGMGQATSQQQAEARVFMVLGICGENGWT